VGRRWLPTRAEVCVRNRSDIESRRQKRVGIVDAGRLIRAHDRHVTITMSNRSVSYDGNIFHDANQCLMWLEVIDMDGEGHTKYLH